MYTIGNNNTPMSVNIKNKIWTLGRYDEEAGYNNCENWHILEIVSLKENYIEIPKHIKLGNINMILKSRLRNNIIYVISGPEIKTADDPSKNDTFVSNNPALYSYDTANNLWAAIKTFSQEMILFSILEKNNGEIILIGLYDNYKYEILSDAKNYQKVNSDELECKFGFTFFLDDNNSLWVYGGMDNKKNYYNEFKKIDCINGEITYKQTITSFDFRSFPYIRYKNGNLFIIGGTKDGYYPASEIIKYDLMNNSFIFSQDIRNITNNYFANYCIAEDENSLFVSSGYIFNDKSRKYQYREYKINEIHETRIERGYEGTRIYTN